MAGCYEPVLVALLDELAQRMHADQSDDLMRAVGRRLADAVGRPPAGDLGSRVAAAAGLLDTLGGAAEVERRDGAFVIRGCGGCPLSSATSRRPELCQAIESLLSDFIGVPVQECCDRAERPRCHFEIPIAA